MAKVVMAPFGGDLEYEKAESEWMSPPETTQSGLPVEDERYIKNVRNNCLLDLPNLGVTKDHDRIMVMVCGGPTAKEHLEEIREKSLDPKYTVFCSNKTHDWLIENKIIPDYQFIIDPKSIKVEDVRNPHPGVKYLIGISCDHAVYEALEGYDVTRVFSVSGVGKPSDVQVIQALFPYEEITYLFGGTMAGLRAMSLADVMGFMKVEYYGFDSCYFKTDEDGEPIYYSYEKQRAENILETETDPAGTSRESKSYLTTPCFASQATQYIKWKHRYEWIDFTIHGDSLTREIHMIDVERNKPKHDLVITDYHRKINRELHLKAERADLVGEFPFGTSGRNHAGRVAVLAGQIIRKFGPITILDYGCGKRTLENVLPPIEGVVVHNYDPCVEGLDTPPDPADIVVCTDVLEHVEPGCLDNVLDDLKRVTKIAAFISVATVRATKSYSDGQNCHLIVEDEDWWRPKIKKRFFVTETEVDQNHFAYILQAKDAEARR